ncbi:DUF6207 family protein [Streptomyces lavendulae]|uniref:DUF6207 family protein n=1 Tax=Streptomyces lavendulae TaxID=1914 RepID=UPI0036ED69CC
MSPRALPGAAGRSRARDDAEPGTCLTTAARVMTALEERWATSGISPGRREPCEPGVRARVYADVLRPGRKCPSRKPGQAALVLGLARQDDVQPQERLGSDVAVALPERVRPADGAKHAYPDAVPGPLHGHTRRTCAAVVT